MSKIRVSRRIWRELRKEIINRDHFKCQLCPFRGDYITLSVDHIIPRSVAPHLKYEPSNLRTLCYPCHKNLNEKKVKMSSVTKLLFTVDGSKDIEIVWYDLDNFCLYVLFKTGALYSYAGVNMDTALGFLYTESVGKYFHSEIKPHYKFEQKGIISKDSEESNRFSQHYNVLPRLRKRAWG